MKAGVANPDLAAFFLPFLPARKVGAGIDILKFCSQSDGKPSDGLSCVGQRVRAGPADLPEIKASGVRAPPQPDEPIAAIACRAQNGIVPLQQSKAIGDMAGADFRNVAADQQGRTPGHPVEGAQHARSQIARPLW